jgi:hypothetical protein
MPDVSPKRCPDADRNGAANGNNDDSDAPLSPVSYTEPKMRICFYNFPFVFLLYIRGTLR